MDFCSLLNHRSSELILLKDRGLYKSQQIFQDWEILFPPGNSLSTASELNFSRPGSETIEQPVQGIAVYNSPENSSNFAAYSTMTSQKIQKHHSWHKLARQKG